MFKFVHCADLHLGSPFSGLRKLDPESARELVLAPFAAFDRLAEAAISDGALFMVLAGDVFDSGSPSLYAETRFRETLTRLDAAGVRVFWARGNHDCGAEVDGLPANTTVFPAGRAEVFPVTVDGRTVASVAGISHSGPAETRDLAPEADALLRDAPGFRVAVLHANVDGIPGHEPYAPVPLEELRRGCADYWALGHIHRRRVLCEQPLAVYSGSPQGRSVNEPGARGGVLVEVDDAGVPRLREIDVQIVRFETLVLDDLENVADAETLLRRFRAALPDVRERLRLRLVLASGTVLNSRLRAADESALEEMFVSVLRSQLPLAELESVRVNTSGPPSAARREGLSAEVAAVRDGLDLNAELAALPLSPSEFSGFSEAELADIAHEAEELLLDYLCGDLRSGK